MNLTVEDPLTGDFQPIDKINYVPDLASGLGQSAIWLLDRDGRFSGSDIGKSYCMKDGDQVFLARLTNISEQVGKISICSFERV